MTMDRNRRTARASIFAVRAIGQLLLLAIVTGIFAAAAILLVVPRVTGADALTVLTGSMTPEIAVGSIVMVRPVDPSSLRVGDIATYRTEGGEEAFITHRIVEIDESTNPVSFTFKGDANRGPDLKPVSAEAIRGEVWFDVPYLGTVRDALQGGAGLTLLAALFVGALSIGLFAGAIRDHRRDENGQDAPADLVEVDSDRALIMAEISTAAIFGTPPADAAKEWGGILLRQTDSSFTVLIAPEPWDLSAIVRDLEVFDPLALTIVETPKRISIRLDATSAQRWDATPLTGVGGHAG